MDFTFWEWFNLALAGVFVPCYIVLWYRHLREPNDSSLIGGGPVSSTAWGLGLIMIVLAITLPLSESVSDSLGLAASLLMLAAFGGSWLTRDRRDTNEPNEP